MRGIDGRWSGGGRVRSIRELGAGGNGGRGILNSHPRGGRNLSISGTGRIWGGGQAVVASYWVVVAGGRRILLALMVTVQLILLGWKKKGGKGRKGSSAITRWKRAMPRW
ncbi:unnamed protein product [Urochloa humidicola]